MVEGLWTGGSTCINAGQNSYLSNNLHQKFKMLSAPKSTTLTSNADLSLLTNPHSQQKLPVTRKNFPFVTEESELLKHQVQPLYLRAHKTEGFA